MVKREKGKILDKFTNVTGYHRKAAIRLLRQGNQPVKHGIIVSRSGFSNNARAMASHIKDQDDMTIELKQPEDLLKIGE